MKGYVNNIESETLNNENFRKVVYTAKHSQLVVMSLKPGEEIGMEVHPDTDQFFRIDSGKAKIVIDGNEYNVQDGFAAVVPAGSQHNVINTSNTNHLKLYTLYCPAHHRNGVVHATKEQAMADKEEFDGSTTE
jgi:mannose-6-phosphate isomerase-like protein (cupin superfamily)